MAMTKVEKSKIEALELALALYKALAWPSDECPDPMSSDDIEAGRTTPADSGYGHTYRVCVGWFCNEHASDPSFAVTRGWSTGNLHSREGGVSASQGRGRMFATEAQAWAFLRHAVTHRVAKQLADIDARRAKALGRP